MNSILDALKKKQPPKQEQKAQITISRRVPETVVEPVEDVTEKIDVDIETKPTVQEQDVKIIDKRDKGFDRSVLLQKMKHRGLVVPTISQPSISVRAVMPPPTDEVKVEPPIIPTTEQSKRKITLKRRTESKEKTKAETKPKLTISRQTLTDEMKSADYVPIVSDKPRLLGKSRLSSSIHKGTITALAPQVEQDIRRQTDMKTIAEVAEGEYSMTDLQDHIPEKDTTQIIAPNGTYFMNNREAFVNFINQLFIPYRNQLIEDLGSISCENRTGDFNLLTHQKIVRDYINHYTPYRGVLVYHGLGSGKTCSSIAIAEGLKTYKPIIVMTPASLRRNYIEELKTCGDELYRKQHHWEFMSVIENPPLLTQVSQLMSLPEDFIRKNGGVWLINVNKEKNYETLSSDEKVNLNLQIDEMIRNKYRFISYNGLRKSHWRELTRDGTINPFDDSVVVIDEVHNFISRIVNRLKTKSKTSMYVLLYEKLMEAQNCRLVFLTGTPIINYPNEIAIIFNMLRGYIKTWSFNINIQTQRKIDQESLEALFKKYALMDTLQYSPSSKTITITRNPFGFVRKMNKETGEYLGVKYMDDEKTNIRDDKFIGYIFQLLKKNDIEAIPKSLKVEYNKALPDSLDDFMNYYVNDQGIVKNVNMLKRRILGLTSYLSDMDALLPKYNESTDYKEVLVPMSDYQFNIYETYARKNERDQEAKARKKRAKGGAGVNGDLYETVGTTYRIFSRVFCNFVFPEEIQRPLPNGSYVGKEETIEVGAINEDDLDATTKEEKLLNPDGMYEEEDFERGTDAVGAVVADDSSPEKKTYEARIQQALNELDRQSGTYLTLEALQTYSPKFLYMMRNIQSIMENPERDGLQLIYSNFRKLEGIGIFSLVLKENGFARFKIKKHANGEWHLDILPEDMGKPKFAFYTGTEDAEEKEIMRNIFNSTWGNVPTSLVNEIKEIANNNFYGEIIKIIMITASGAEGISLRNVRHVHIMEPYWHPVRLDQVIGRARRICSHQDLPMEARNIDVFVYMATLTEKQYSSDFSRELRVYDRSRKNPAIYHTSDEYLYETAMVKRDINRQILKAVKESAFDCAIHNIDGKNKEGLTCFYFGMVGSKSLAYKPNYQQEENDKVANINRATEKFEGKVMTVRDKKYMLRNGTNEVYDYISWQNGNPILIGNIEEVEVNGVKKKKLVKV